MTGQRGTLLPELRLSDGPTMVVNDRRHSTGPKTHHYQIVEAGPGCLRIQRLDVNQYSYGTWANIAVIYNPPPGLYHILRDLLRCI